MLCPSLKPKHQPCPSDARDGDGWRCCRLAVPLPQFRRQGPELWGRMKVMNSSP